MTEFLPYFTGIISIIFLIALYIGIQEFRNKDK
jgi:hypothetical protein